MTLINKDVVDISKLLVHKSCQSQKVINEQDDEFGTSP